MRNSGFQTSTIVNSATTKINETYKDKRVTEVLVDRAARGRNLIVQQFRQLVEKQHRITLECRADFGKVRNRAEGVDGKHLVALSVGVQFACVGHVLGDHRGGQLAETDLHQRCK